jgi:hypothetical protein
VRVARPRLCYDAGVARPRRTALLLLLVGLPGVASAQRRRPAALPPVTVATLLSACGADAGVADAPGFTPPLALLGTEVPAIDAAAEAPAAGSQHLAADDPRRVEEMLRLAGSFRGLAERAEAQRRALFREAAEATAAGRSSQAAALGRRQREREQEARAQRENAVRMLEAVLTEQPGHPRAEDVFCQLVQLRQGLGQAVAARSLLQQVSARFPQGRCWRQLQAQLGELLFAQGQCPLALPVFTQLVGLPDDGTALATFARSRAAWCRRRAGDERQAREDFVRVVRDAEQLPQVAGHPELAQAARREICGSPAR